MAFGRVVIREAVFVDITHGPVSPAPVGEFRRDDIVGAIKTAAFVNNGKLIPRLQVSRKIDVPSKNLRKLSRQVFGKPGFSGRVTQRRDDRSLNTRQLHHIEFLRMPVKPAAEMGKTGQVIMAGRETGKFLGRIRGYGRKPAFILIRADDFI